jgi:prefoldin subunit 5
MVKANSPVEAKKTFLIMINEHKTLQKEVKRFTSCRDEFTRLLNMTTNEDVKRIISNKLADLDNNIETMNESLKKSENRIFEYQLVNYQVDSIEVALMEVDSVSIDSLKNLVNDDVDTLLVPVQN